MATGPRGVTKDRGWAWVVAAATLVLNFFMIGFTKSFGLFFVEFLELFQGSSSATSLIFGVQGLSFSIGSYLVMIFLVHRLTCRSLVIVGSLGFGLGVVISSRAKSLAEAIVSIGVLGGVGQSFMTGPYMVMLGKYFDKRYGIASGISVCGGSLGQIIFPPLFRHLVNTYGIRGGLLILGGLALNCVVCGALLRPLPEMNSLKRGKSFSNRAINHDSKQNGFISKTNDLDGGKPPEIVPDENGSHGEVDGLAVYPNGHTFDTSSEYLLNAGRGGSPAPKVRYHELILSGRPDLHLSTGSIYMAPEMFSGSQILEFNTREDDSGSPDKPDSCFLCHCSKTPVVDCSLVKNPLYLICVVSLCFAYVGSVTLVMFIPPRAEEVGLSSEGIPILLMVMGGCDLIGRVLIGFAADSHVIPRYCILKFALILLSVTATLVFLATDFWAFVGVSVAYGFLGGTLFSLQPVVLVDFFGLENLSSSIGIMFLFQGIATCGLSPLLGWIRDVTGSYSATFFVIGGILLTSGSMLCLVPFCRKWMMVPNDKSLEIGNIESQLSAEKPTENI